MASPARDISPMEALSALGSWFRNNPLPALLLLAVTGAIAYFFGFAELFIGGSHSAATWAWESWNGAPGEESDGSMTHANFVPLIALWLAWHHRAKIAAAPKTGSNWGLLILLLGSLIFLASARTLQPRLALMALPVVLLGVIYFLWGRRVARILLFPCAFLLFTIHSAFMEQATFRLQFIITGAVGVLANLIGLQIAAVGTTLTAADGAFNFEIAEGCSGIRSLIAMSMLTAVYVHLTQRELWKKLVIFSASIVFALIGNIGRIFTVLLVAKYIDKDIAGGIYHDYSAFIFFPFALGAMIGCARLLNLNFSKAVTAANRAGQSSRRDETSYDY